MSEIEQSFNLLRMIEEGELITLKAITTRFILTEKDIREAVRSGDITRPIKKFGALYYIKAEIELLYENLMSGESDD